MKTIRTLTPKEHEAIQCAAFLHGRNFKSAIRQAWYDGGYRRQWLEEHSGTLQRMRNSADGHDLLDSLRARDFVANKAVAYLMGKNTALSGVGNNPFGVATLAKAWRKGYADHHVPTPLEQTSARCIEACRK